MDQSQKRLTRRLREADWRRPIGTENGRGGRWNGDAWVYGQSPWVRRALAGTLPAKDMTGSIR